MAVVLLPSVRIAAADSATGIIVDTSSTAAVHPGQLYVAIPTTISADGDGRTVEMTSGPWAFTFSAGTDAPPLQLGEYERTGDAASGSPGASIGYDMTGCTWASGRFEVVDVPHILPDTTVDELGIDFEIHCQGTSSGPIYGSIRLNSPVPMRLMRPMGPNPFADQPVGTVGPANAITLTNIGQASVGLGSLAFSGTDPEDFEASMGDCPRTLTVGSTCSMMVRFAPTAEGPRDAVLTLHTDEPLPLRFVLHAAGQSALLLRPSVLGLVSSPGDFVGNGQTLWIGPGQFANYMPGPTSQIGVVTAPGTVESFTLLFDPPAGQDFQPGNYSTDDGAYLSVSGEGRGCSSSTGSFTILDGPTNDASGALASVAIDFVQYCDGSTAPLTGRLRFHSLVPADGVPPLVSEPASGVVFAHTTGSTTIPVAGHWTGRDEFSGVARYDVSLSTDGRPYRLLSATNMSTSVLKSMSSGHSYRLRVRAHDRAGNASAWSYGRTVKLRVVADSSSSIVYRGGWRRAARSAAMGGTSTYSSTSGATASLSFTGRSISLVAPIGATRGQARISIDGVPVATVDLHSGATVSRAIVFVKVWSKNGTHRISVRVLGTPGHGRVDIDSFAVLS